MLRQNPSAGEGVDDAELFLSQAFVLNDRRVPGGGLFQKLGRA
jgi:hypothetical protein